MGVLRQTFSVAFNMAAYSTLGAAGYLAATTKVQTPLAPTDPVWTSKFYKKLNAFDNDTTQDLVYKRVPLKDVKPELLDKEGALALELCRGVWSGLGTSSDMAN